MIFNEKSNHSEIQALSQAIERVNTSIRQNLQIRSGQIECIAWTDAATEAIEDLERVFPHGTKVFHCTNTSISDPHHWLEADLGNKRVFVWDDTRQKSPNKAFLPRDEAASLWKDYGDRNTQRLQIFPEFSE